MHRVFLFAVTFISLIPFVDAAGPAITDPAKTGIDFQIQGEYSGELQSDQGKGNFGVQVIAQGNGKFKAVAYRGGLPGDGWDGKDPLRIDGEFALQGDGTLVIQGEHGTGTIDSGVLSIDLGDDGTVNGKLKRVVRKSPTLGKAPPEGAVVLYADKADAAKWKGGKADEDGHLMQGVTSKETFGSHQLHVEFRLPYMPEARGQGRGNSGCYVQGKYEVQMLDSFGLEGKMNECGGIYSVSGVATNMCFPPLSWQTYDIDYTAAKYDGDKRVANPRITVRHNGVVIHDDIELPGERNTTAAPQPAGPEPGPVYLQNHGNPVRYRNIWVVKKDE